jgi:hypothetical protein
MPVLDKNHNESEKSRQEFGGEDTGRQRSIAGGETAAAWRPAPS